IASHGSFDSNPNKTFLLTYNGKINMDELEQFVGIGRFRDKPIELLTLSACQTAAGDDRAALGLAGIAVKSGARSALATLWFVNDQTTSLLTTDFYNFLTQAEISKAQALQKAQIKVLSDRRYRHPGYWSPYLLIGNWL
ncbi:MAG: CHAT domain-containing protein, partial [Gammaproteobacteria bacterium]|nr:CHAT domain-containing protein [Gammaproteobacteria bacterium]